MRGPGYGGRGKPRRDRTGDVYAGLRVLRDGRKGCDFGWICACLACGREFFLRSTKMAEYERGGYGCGCRQRMMGVAASAAIVDLQKRVRVLEERLDSLLARRSA